MNASSQTTIILDFPQIYFVAPTPSIPTVWISPDTASIQVRSALTCARQGT